MFFLRHNGTMTNPTFNPKSTALLVMDYQPSILGSLKEPDHLLARVGECISAVRAAGGTVAYVRVGFTDADYAAFPSYSAMGARAKAAGENMRADSPKTAVHASIAPQPGDIVVRKNRVGAFSTTDLHRQLKGLGVDTVVLAGIHTSGVTLTTVREAHDLDYRVFVLADACGDPDPDVHEFLTQKIFPKQATVISVAQFGQQLQGV